jgi:hypothetical protein
MPDPIRVEDLEEGVDEDGLVEDSYRGVETRYAPFETMGLTAKYLFVIADYQDGFIETRIPFDVLEQLGWTRAKQGMENEEGGSNA